MKISVQQHAGSCPGTCWYLNYEIKKGLNIIAHKNWCKRPCCDCTAPCGSDETIPCSPDCENLTEDGQPLTEQCLASGCDGIKYIIYK